jgi:uncharacterized membrane protein
LIALSTQAISGSNYFYGVYIKNIELGQDIKKEIDKHFKKKLNIALLLVMIMYLLASFIFNINIGINILIFTTIYLVLYFIYLKKAYEEVKFIKNKYLEAHDEFFTPKNNIPKKVVVDTELINAKQKLKKKFKMLFGICIGISIVSFLYILLNYNSMPETIITHWGASGKPDGFSQKNIINVFFTNCIDLSMVILFAVMGVGTISSKTYIDTKNLEVNRRKAIKYLNGLGYSFLILTLTIQSITTTIPVFMVQGKSIPLSLTLFGCIAPIFITVPLIYFYIMLGTIKPKDKSSYSSESDDDKWIYGFIYYNKEDPSLMVEKRLGAGWSINMANPMGKVTSIIVVAIMVASLAICFI